MNGKSALHAQVTTTGAPEQPSEIILTLKITSPNLLRIGLTHFWLAERQ